MRIENISHDLKVLESHMKTIQTYIYANLRKVDNYALSDEECYQKCKYEFVLFKQRMKSLQIELEIEQDKQSKRKV